MGKMKKKISKWKPKLSRKELERRRLAAGEDLKAGMKESDVARKYGVNPSSVTRWKQMLEKEGMKGLKRRKAPGNKSKLSEDQQKDIKEIILQGAAAYGYKTDLWTLKRVAEVIMKEFGISYHFRSLSDVLHRMGLSSQKPARRAAERNQKAVQTWLEEQWVKDRKNW
jgi:transposase